MNRLTKTYRRLTSDISEVPEFFKQKKYPSIDGFRAVSIAIVLGFHMGRTGNTLYNIIFNGSLGVDVFFVISGFLITSLLLKENVVTGSISLKDFYLRRILRIFPAAYLYLLTILVLNYIFKLNISLIYLGAAFMYVINFQFLNPYKSDFVSHYWSLSVEEQFYVIFPFILKKSFRVFLAFILMIVFLLPSLIDLQIRVPQVRSLPFFIVTHYFIKFQGIAVGCLFSILVYKDMINFKAIKSIRLFLKIACVVLIFFLHHTDAVDKYSVYSNLLISVLIGFLIILNLFFADDWMYRFLNLRWVAKIGVLSYSIYIWHLLFLNTTLFPIWITHSPLALFLSVLTAALSYRYWERIFLKMKKTVTPVNRMSNNDTRAKS